MIIVFTSAIHGGTWIRERVELVDKVGATVLHTDARWQGEGRVTTLVAIQGTGSAIGYLTPAWQCACKQAVATLWMIYSYESVCYYRLVSY